ncbi:MAG: phosphoribosylanthranilate isomerase [Firmicutes bacterium]|nr:phosphoribosylanthranilate isomerase [Bacillota bacterium]
MVKVKVCGITNLKDARETVESGADAIGFIFAASPRQINPLAAKQMIEQLPPFVFKVGVFANESLIKVKRIMSLCHLDLVQLHGEETPEYCDKLYPKAIKVIRLKSEDSIKVIPAYKASAILLDSYSPNELGGTGISVNWEWAEKAKRYGMPIILSGGLNPDNVADAIAKVQPYAVDVCSGVEKSFGRKDPAMVREFIMRVRGEKQREEE